MASSTTPLKLRTKKEFYFLGKPNRNLTTSVSLIFWDLIKLREKAFSKRLDIIADRTEDGFLKIKTNLNVCKIQCNEFELCVFLNELYIKRESGFRKCVSRVAGDPTAVNENKSTGSSGKKKKTFTHIKWQTEKESCTG